VRTGIDKRDADMRSKQYRDTDVEANRWATFQITKVETAGPLVPGKEAPAKLTPEQVEAQKRFGFTSRVLRCFRLLQPVGHAHLAIHRRRRRDVLFRLLMRARAPVELAEAEVTVRDDGPHPELLGEGQRLTIVAFSVFERVAADGDVTEEAQCRRFVGPVTTLAVERQASRGELESVPDPIGEDVHLGQIPQEDPVGSSVSHALSRAQRVLQQRDALRSPS
jgi:hypothetical protein